MAESSSFQGVLVSGQIQAILGDLIGGNKIINGNPEFEDAVLSFIRSENTRNAERLALTKNIVALQLATVFVDQMRLLYITTGPRLKAANAHLLSHFIERAERDTKLYDKSAERYAEQFDRAFLAKANVVEQHSAWVLGKFATGNPLSRNEVILFQKMADAASAMIDVLVSADADMAKNYKTVVDEIGNANLSRFGSPHGFAMADEIGILRFRIQTEALERLQNDQPSQIYSIDDDADGRFGPLYAVIDHWLLNHCEPGA